MKHSSAVPEAAIECTFSDSAGAVESLFSGPVSLSLDSDAVSTAPFAPRLSGRWDGSFLLSRLSRSEVTVSTTGGSSSAVADNITEEAVSSLQLEPCLMLGE